MIIPNTRLLVFFAFTGVPALALIGVDRSFLEPLALFLCVLTLFLASDVFLLKGISRGITFSFPDKLRIIEKGEAELEIHIAQNRPEKRSLLLAFALPPQMISSKNIEVVELSAEVKATSISWPFYAKRRGSFFIAEYYTGYRSPLGFWTIRYRHQLNLSVHVYPNLRTERRGLEEILLRGREGMLVRRQMGQGREFEKLRDYIPGDNYADIHWKATARRANPVTKLFQIESTKEVYVILDTSRLSARSIVDESGNFATCLDYYVTAAMMLGLVTQRQKDHFGVIAFADKMRRFVRAGSGLCHYNACRDALFELEPLPVAVNFQEIITQIKWRLRKRALLIFLTNLDDPMLAESFTHSIESISRQHLILVDIFPQTGTKPIFSNGTLRSESEIYRNLAEHHQWHQLAQLQLSLHRKNVQLFQMTDPHMAVHLARQYLEVKQSQRL